MVKRITGYAKTNNITAIAGEINKYGSIFRSMLDVIRVAWAQAVWHCAQATS
jgi:hypothetical protein